MKKFNLELLKSTSLQGEKVAVNCVTKEQAKEYVTWVRSLGKDVCTNTCWSEYKENTCYILNEYLRYTYGSKTTLLNIGYKVIPFKEALLPEGDKNTIL